MSARAASELPAATFEATAPLPAAIAPALTVPPEIVIPEFFSLMCLALPDYAEARDFIAPVPPITFVAFAFVPAARFVALIVADPVT